ncbi:Transcriptional regulator, LacI family [Nostocoides japonicum T1-X7]|uniref:Transcriptional regulator, LacI family n=1 Tax=Nostocoides japonicum T1-X7 TaxID=1194083 RepID=A0A077M472_9MICO|nr:LacI family DNA-binding transcriptional regulator [Tetrasphaera japonica]CCH78935.1 Transcriptional regulator, LacI family [Tetrasphaera japonica T1-X7]
MPRARLADVAARAGVSPATVSLVLRDRPGPSEATRAAVQAAVADLGYRPDRTASSLARKRSQLLGVVLDVSHPFHAALVDALDGAVSGTGLDLVLSTTTSRRDERMAVETLLDSRCAAVALLGSTLAGPTLDALAQEVPVVVVGRPGSRLARGVWADDAAGLRLAVDHLADLGHDRIAFVDGGAGTIATARRRGYRAALRGRGLEAYQTVIVGGSTEAAGLAAGARVAAEPSPSRPTALVAFNDRCAVGARDALLRAGIGVPDEVSIVGYDDSPLARLATIDLTSVSQDPEAIARESVRVVEAMLDGEEVADVVVQPRLVVRSSTAPPARTAPAAGGHPGRGA